MSDTITMNVLQSMHVTVLQKRRQENYKTLKKSLRKRLSTSHFRIYVARIGGGFSG